MPALDFPFKDEIIIWYFSPDTLEPTLGGVKRREEDGWNILNVLIYSEDVRGLWAKVFNMYGFPSDDQYNKIIVFVVTTM